MRTTIRRYTGTASAAATRSAMKNHGVPNKPARMPAFTMTEP
jgi:hypothetical protein